MEHGDLALSVRRHYVLVLEGVLCNVSMITVDRVLRKAKTVGYNLHWLDLPLRRFATMRRQYPEIGAEIVTFISQETADFAGDFLNQTGVSYDSLTYQPFDTWVSLLQFREGLQAVYDSDPDRLDRYGQVGRAVVQGEDFT